ncbi:exoribonculease Dhp1 [Cladochytrium replicatum]|nr:exoribonculease Dhp1 [Cladochytrium replicatum]
MGIPALFRWLSQKYPKVTSPVAEEHPREINGMYYPVDISALNPNGVEFDNLYLDMNGIIHPCCHPDDKPAPPTEDAMYVEIFKYIDRIMGMIRPRKILYMAIDGVAPRAKMNQQRSRRFRASQEAQEKLDEEERLRHEWEKENKRMLPAKDTKSHFDSNCITPGTPFMDRLATALRYYIADRQTNDPAWKHIKVILSDASVPGEGEHKVMDFIRRQRSAPAYNPDTRHVLYGLDADLIMLALGTHEPYFKILREDVFAKEKSNSCFICGQTDHIAAVCTGKPKEKVGEFDEKSKPAELKPFVFLHVHILREYLEAELKLQDLPFAWDLERAIDDWIFLCFFVGNDFLPHLPSLEIREGAIDRLIEIWKRLMPTSTGYITKDGSIDLEIVERLLEELGRAEDEIFVERRQIEERKREARQRRKREAKANKEARERLRNAGVPSSVAMQMALENVPSYSVKMGSEERAEINKGYLDRRKDIRMAGTPAVMSSSPSRFAFSALEVARMAKESQAGSKVGENKAAAEALRNALGKKGGPPATLPAKRSAAEVEEEEEVVVEGGGVVAAKLSDSANSDTPMAELSGTVVEEAATSDTPIPDEPGADEAIDEVVEDDDEEEVVETMTVAEVPIPVIKKKKEDEDSDAEPDDNVRLWESGWKDRYYRNKFGVELADEEFRREVVKKYVEGFCWVLKYYYQGVQSWKWYYPYHYSPFASDFVGIRNLKIDFELGQPFKPVEQLMGVFPAASRQHIPPAFHKLMTSTESEIIDFYPERIQIDMNGKKHVWQGVALLPFIDEKRLLDAMAPFYEQMTDEEKRRNEKGWEVVAVASENPLYEFFCSVYTKRAKEGEQMFLDPKLSKDLFGSIVPDPDACLPGSTLESPLVEEGLGDVVNNQCLTVGYIMPAYPPGHVFAARLLKTVQLPPRELDADDIYFVKLGMSGGGRGRGRGRGRGGYNRAPGRGAIQLGTSDRFIRHGIGAGDNGDRYGPQTKRGRYEDEYGGGDSYSRSYEGQSYDNNGGRNGGGNGYGRGYDNSRYDRSYDGGARGGYRGGYAPQHNGGGYGSQQHLGRRYDSGGGSEGYYNNGSGSQQHYQGGGNQYDGYSNSSSGYSGGGGYGSGGYGSSSSYGTTPVRA